MILAAMPKILFPHLALLFLILHCTCVPAQNSMEMDELDLVADTLPPSLRIDLVEGPQPWTSLDLEPPGDQFQFAIVSDRTGGLRPGVFSEAVDKLNLVRPPFVMSVGDLITGYTTDLAELERQWDEFDRMVERLEMPFFYVPGNHDITNPVMDSLWTRRYGPKYYHFVYQDVLFLCLNSEDAIRGAGRGSISDEQFAYVERVLADNADVRWTFLFLHQPLWDQDDPRRWPDVERLLRNREHSVFAGHVHHYQKFSRNNGRYYTLATTGGGSRLRGPRLGEFDHVTWVTMTDGGPVLANISLDGIYSDSVTTREDYTFYRDLVRSHPVRFSTTSADQSLTRGVRVAAQLHNPADLPMHVRVEPAFSPDYFVELDADTLTVPPNGVVDYTFTLRGRKGMTPNEKTGVSVLFSLTYDYGPSALTIPLTYRIAPQPQRSLARTQSTVSVDGRLNEWNLKDLAYSYGSGNDGAVRWGMRLGEDSLYLAAKVADDHVVVRPNETAWQQDYVAFVINADPRAAAIMNTGDGWYRDSYILLASPTKGEIRGTDFYQERYVDHPANYRCVAVEGGFVLEAAVPLSYVVERQGKNWQTLRVNVQIQDEDPGRPDKPRTSWQPNWRGPDNVVGSGVFERKN